jgi:hypothetical protein
MLQFNLCCCSGGIKAFGKGLLALGLLAACLTAIPGAARLGLLILATAPNPRHPPGVLLGEATGWAILAALVGAVCVIIGEAVVMPEKVGRWQTYKGLILGAMFAILLAVPLGISLAVLQMSSVDGQAITSVRLAILSGLSVSVVGVIAGIVLGSTLRRSIGALLR